MATLILTGLHGKETKPAAKGTKGGRAKEEKEENIDFGRQANHEVLECFKLVQAILTGSLQDMQRPVGMKREPPFWRSRRADFFIDLLNEMRAQLNMSEMCPTSLRVGVARKFGKPDDWLMPTDGLSKLEVEAVINDYHKKWATLCREYPDGIEDNSSDYLFTPNRDDQPTEESDHISPVATPSNLERNSRAPRVQPVIQTTDAPQRAPVAEFLKAEGEWNQAQRTTSRGPAHGNAAIDK